MQKKWDCIPLILYLSFPQLEYNAIRMNPISECKDTKLSENAKIPEAGIDLNFFFRHSFLTIEGWDDSSEEDDLTLYVRSTESKATCPYCGHQSEKIHSRYYRNLRDLPAFGKKVGICFRARKFFCHNQECRYRTFAEQPGNEIFRYRRRTRRCEVCVHRHALVLSSPQCSRLLGGIGVSVSRSTVLRDLHRMRVPDERDVRRIGIDDWAFRKGHDYGSLIVNLATGRPIDLLPSRNGRDFSEWLDSHDKVWLLSRDRATAYSAAAGSRESPVTQIADRFHLMKNLGECIGDAISSRYADISSLLGGDGESTGAVATIKNEYAEERIKEVKRLQEEGRSISETRAILGMSRRTVEKYRSLETPSQSTPRKKAYAYEGRFNEVKRLQKEGKSVSETMSMLGMSHATVVKYRGLDSYPAPRRRSVGKWLPYKDSVEEQYARGTSLDEIFRTLVGQGVSMGRTSFYWSFSYLSDGHRGYRPAIQKARMEEDWQKGIRPDNHGAHVCLPPVRQVAYTVMKRVLDKELSESEGSLLESLKRLDWFGELLGAAISFRQNLRSGCPSLVDGWIEKYKDSEIPRLQTFVKGVKMDIQAVKNSILFRESNGILEGWVNKLKAVKRSMYGKAKIDLLKIKMVMPAWVFN